MKSTNIKLRNLVIYQIYVRNFSSEGTFDAVVGDLDRIKEMNVDVVYLLPIHPIGKIDRKGSMGCPYSIMDYREVADELGTMSDFQHLIDEVHNRGMKIMMDIVFNHTSKDSVLFRNHPEYFLYDNKERLMSKASDWTDVADLDYSVSKKLWDELSDTLVMYSKMGVDGYRCDVASMVPIEFWKHARKEVSKINRSTIWLSESVHGSFLKEIRDNGYYGASESEIFQVFDMAYDYDVEPYFRNYLRGTTPLKDFLEGIQRQEEIYPANYVKMKNLENHDQFRIAKEVDNDMNKIKNWTAFTFFQKGAVLIYAGQEFTAMNKPSLFEKDPFDKNEDISDFISKLAKLKKQKVFANGIFTIKIPQIDGVAYNIIKDDKKTYHGIFNVGMAIGEIKTELEDGKYRNILSGKMVSVIDGKIGLGKDPVIIKVVN